MKRPGRLTAVLLTIAAVGASVAFVALGSRAAGAAPATPAGSSGAASTKGPKVAPTFGSGLGPKVGSQVGPVVGKKPAVRKCTLSGAGPVADGGFEQICPTDPTEPLGWDTVTHGNPGAAFGTTTSAYKGSEAVTTTVTTDGTEAGWTASVIAPQASQDYRLTFWQNSSIYVYAYFVITAADGSVSYQSLMSVPASDGVWSQYHDWFITPASVTSMQLVIATSGIGSFSLDNVDLTAVTTPNPPIFTAPMVSISFDDGLESSMLNADPVLQRDGYDATYFVNGATINTPGYFSNADISTLAAEGNEIGSHLYHHSDLAQLDSATVTSELNGGLAAVQGALGNTKPVPGFASPYGSFTSAVVAQIMAVHAYHRDTDGQLNTKAGLDARQIHGRLVTAATTLEQFQSWLAQARQTNSWLVLVYHGIDETADAADTSGEAGYVTTPEDFAAQIGLLQTSGIAEAPIWTAYRTLNKQ